MGLTKWMGIAALGAMASAACSDDGATPTDGGSEGVVLMDGGKADAAPTCELPAHSCYKPFVCRVPPGGGAKGCFSADGDVPACKGTPAGQDVAFNTTKSGLVVHWPLKPGCVAVSYTADVAQLAALIDQGSHAWSDVGCSDLCLEPPQHDDNVPEFHRRERRIHIRSGTPGDPTAPAQTDLIFEQTTGRIMKAEILVDVTKLDKLQDHHWLPLLGMALGLKTADAKMDSVMASGWQMTSLTQSDEVALCKLYGKPSYCGD